MSSLKAEIQNVSTTISAVTTTTTTPLVTANITTTTEINWSTPGQGNYSTPSYWNSTGYWNNTGYWNYTINGYPPSYGNPYYPNTVVTTTSYAYFDYAYLYYLFLLVLLIGALVCIKLGMDRRRRVEREVAAQQRRARQQAQDAYLNTNSTLNINSDSSCHMGAKSADYPPAYDSVIQPHLNVTTNGEEGTNAAAAATTSSTNISNGVSTITIETDIPSNAASNVDLPNASNTTQAAAGSVPPPSTTTIIDISANEKLNDHSTV